MKTIIELFETSVSKYPDKVFLWEKKDGVFQGTTYREVHRQVLQFAAGLQATGIRKGDRLGLISEGRNQWLIGELGILYAGAINVPLSVKLEAGTELKFRLGHSGCRMVLVSEGQAPKIEEIRKDLPGLEKVIYLDEKADAGTNDLSYDQIIETGKTFLRENRELVEQAYQSVGPHDLANISYTSGTTADPKGIMLSHLNYTANVIQSNTLMKISSEWKTLAFLPWDHAFAHTACLYCLMYNGAGVASLETGKTPMETLKNIPKNIKEIRPTVLMSVPAIAKNFRKGIETAIRQKGKTTQKLFEHALKTAYRYNGIGWDKGKGCRALYKPLIAFYDKILFSKIRENFGGNLKFFIGGGALLDIELQ
ncbi:MAG: AMP-binding protein, partial [Mangrovibacterium sp.]|nr:AMP-binding protein [Mangrovibacterium sp.]